MPVGVHMDDTGRIVNRKTKTDKTKTDINPIPDTNRYRRRVKLHYSIYHYISRGLLNILKFAV